MALCIKDMKCEDCKHFRFDLLEEAERCFLVEDKLTIKENIENVENDLTNDDE